MLFDWLQPLVWNESSDSEISHLYLNDIGVTILGKHLAIFVYVWNIEPTQVFIIWASGSNFFICFCNRPALISPANSCSVNGVRVYVSI